MPTNQTAQALASGSVDAIAAWQPNSGQALKEVPGSTAIFTSANAPGLIYDLLYVSPESLSKRKDDWKKVVKVWFRVVDFIKDDKNKAEYLKIMSARVGLKPEAYEPLMKGTHFLDAAENKKHFAKGKDLASVYGSSQVVDDFNMKNAVYKKAQDVDAYLDGPAPKPAPRRPARDNSPSSMTGSARPLSDRPAPSGLPRRRIFWLPAFLLLLWCAVSYTPFIWHPMVAITDPGSVDYFQKDMQVDRAEFAGENAKASAEGRAPAAGTRENPVYLPAPHRVAKALVTAFRTPPLRDGEPWLHESLGHSIRIIALGFLLSALVGPAAGDPVRHLRPGLAAVRTLRGFHPLHARARLRRPVRGRPRHRRRAQGGHHLHRHLFPDGARGRQHHAVPARAPAGGRPDPGRAAAASLLLNVVVPGVLPLLYRDMRILLGWAWTYLIVAELIGASSGISFFIYQQAKYRNYDNVYAAIIIIGLIGVGTDILLKRLGRWFFPWEKKEA